MALLWKVHISLRRKLALGAILCLSVFMVVIAIIRAALAILPQRTTDTVWIFFWQTIEAATAVIMASVTTMFSLFGQEIASRNSKRKSPQVDMVDARGGYDTLPTNPLIAPTAPEPTLPKSNTFVACGKKGLRNDEFSLEVVSGRGIRVTHDISTTQQVATLSSGTSTRYLLTLAAESNREIGAHQSSFRFVFCLTSFAGVHLEKSGDWFWLWLWGEKFWSYLSDTYLAWHDSIQLNRYAISH